MNALRCKCGVYVTINEHRDNYQTVAQHLDDLRSFGNIKISSDVEKKCIDELIEIQFYPDTPVGFYRIFHYDLDQALGCAISVLADADAA